MSHRVASSSPSVLSLSACPPGLAAICCLIGGDGTGALARNGRELITGDLVLFITIQERNECDPGSHPHGGGDGMADGRFHGTEAVFPHFDQFSPFSVRHAR